MPADERQRIDEAALARWMRDNIAGYAGPLLVCPCGGGPADGADRLRTQNACYVLRRSARAPDREFRLISALYGIGFPVPAAVALCEDVSVIGSRFTVVKAVDGIAHRDAALPGASPAARRAVYVAMITTLARLHETDHAAIGIAGDGRPGDHLGHEVEQWTRRYRTEETGRIEAVERLMTWLPQRVPAQERVSIVHGGYRLDRLIFAPPEHPDAPGVAAVLGWGLSGLGDPVADVSALLMHWVVPADGGGGLGGLDLAELGIPTLEEAVELYCVLTRRESLPELAWHLAYRLAGLAVEAGSASLAETAWRFAAKAGG